MVSVSEKSGSLRVWWENSGLVSVRYGGDIPSGDIFVPLREKGLQEMRGCGAGVIDVRCIAPGLLDLPRIVARDTYATEAAPSALVVRPEHLKHWSRYALLAAGVGTTRVVFTDLVAAFEWADRSL